MPKSMRSAVVGLTSVAVCWAVGITWTLPGVTADDVTPKAEPTAKSRRLDQMRERAKLATIRIVAQPANPTDPVAEAKPVELHPEPMFRYDDQPRGFRDATLWMWTDKGRPVAIGKVEDWRDPKRGPTWITCLTSTSPQLIRASWEGGHDWTAKKPGIQFLPIKDGPKPEKSEAGRLRQFKALSQRFTASMQLYTGDRQELRLLPRQLQRYNIPAERVADAVIFGWTSNGTNPDAVLMIELRTPADQPAEWVYSLAPVTADKLWLKLDDVVVQTKDQTLYPSDDTLIFFFEKNSDTID